LNGKLVPTKGAVAVYAATYIPYLQLSTEQMWAKMQIDKLIEEERPYFDEYLKMVTQLEGLSLTVTNHIEELKAKMRRITSNPRWTIATSASLLQAG
jgi:hypothetical protein